MNLEPQNIKIDTICVNFKPNNAPFAKKKQKKIILEYFSKINVWLVGLV